MQNKKPMILVLAGPNGSGKSTITTFFDKVGKYTNADDIVAATGMDNMEAAILVDKMRYISIYVFFYRKLYLYWVVLVPFILHIHVV